MQRWLTWFRLTTTIHVFDATPGHVHVWVCGVTLALLWLSIVVLSVSIVRLCEICFFLLLVSVCVLWCFVRSFVLFVCFVSFSSDFGTLRWVCLWWGSFRFLPSGRPRWPGFASSSEYTSKRRMRTQADAISSRCPFWAAPSSSWRSWSTSRRSVGCCRTGWAPAGWSDRCPPRTLSWRSTGTDDLGRVLRISSLLLSAMVKSKSKSQNKRKASTSKPESLCQNTLSLTKSLSCCSGASVLPNLKIAKPL